MGACCMVSIQKEKKGIFILITLIFLLGAFLRFYKLGSQEFDKTEMITVNAIKSDFFEMANNRVMNGHSFFYEAIEDVVKSIFGIKEFPLRFISALAGVFSVYILFLIGRLLFDAKSALIASLLFAVSKTNLSCSQFARSNSMALFFTLLSIYFFIRILREQNKTLSLGYVISTIVALHLHNSAVLIVLVEILYLISMANFYQKTSIKKFIICGSIITLFYLPLILSFLYYSKNIRDGLWWIPLPDLSSVKSVFLGFSSSNFVLNINNFDIKIFLFPVLCCTGIIVSFIKNKQMSVNSKGLKTDLFTYPQGFLLLWLVVPVIVLYAYSYLFIPIFSPFYLLAVEAAYLLFVAIGSSFIIDIPKKYKNKWRRLSRLILFFVIILVLFSLKPKELKEFYSRVNPEMKKSVLYVAEKVSEGDELVVFPTWVDFFSNYYHGLKKVDVLRDDQKISLEQDQHLWLMILKSETGKYSYKINLQNKFTILDKKTFNGVVVYYLKNNNIKQDIVVSKTIRGRSSFMDVPRKFKNRWIGLLQVISSFMIIFAVFFLRPSYPKQ